MAKEFRVTDVTMTERVVPRAIAFRQRRRNGVVDVRHQRLVIQQAGGCKPSKANSRRTNTPSDNSTISSSIFRVGSPGVRRVALATHFPLGGGLDRLVAIASDRLEPRPEPVRVVAIGVSREYFDVLGVHTDGDSHLTDEQNGGVAQFVVNRRFAAEYLRGVNPHQTRVALTNERAAGAAPLDGVIVAMADDVNQKTSGIGRVDPIVYFPLRRDPARFVALLIQTSGAATTDELRRTVTSIDPALPLFDVQPLARRIGAATLVWSSLRTAFSLFSAVALAIALVGMYAMTAATITAQWRELAVRIALGVLG